MTMYVAVITDNCILGLDYLKAREAVSDLSQGGLVVNGTIVKGKYKYAEGAPVMTHKVKLVNDNHLFQIQCEDTNRRHSCGGGSGEEEWTLFSTKHPINARGCSLIYYERL